MQSYRTKVVRSGGFIIRFSEIKFSSSFDDL